jgi:exodeoxyribonuclease-3
MLDFLNRRAFALAAFLAVERNQHPSGSGASSGDKIEGFANRSARGNDVINNQRPTHQRCANEVAAFSVILGFFAVETVWNIAIMMVCEGNAGGGCQRYPLVGRAKQNIELDAGSDDGLCIKAAQTGQLTPRVEQASIEKIRADTPRFESEFAETQYAGVYGKLQKLFLVLLHVFPPTVCKLRYDTRAGDRGERMRIVSVNVNGIRAAARKGFFGWMSRQCADVVCLQETKAQVSQLTDRIFWPRGYHAYFHDAEKKGYSGVAIYCRRKPEKAIAGLGWADVDAEGRYLEVQFGALSVISLYLHSGSSSDERQQVKFDMLARFMPYLRKLRRKRREYIICGDWNIAHKAIDLKNWRGNLKNSGFLPEERAWMDELFGPAGYVDAFRVVDDRPDQYTWWSNRGRAWEKNVGWRIDYQVVTPGMAKHVQAARIYKQKRFSDHAPLVIDYDCTL